MIQASCHCGAVVLHITESPREVTACNCSICRRYGALWAYYLVAQVEVRIAGAGDSYICGPGVRRFHRCRACGCVTHWTATDPRRKRMGVNARLMAPEVLNEARVRRLDRAVTNAYLD